MDEGIFDHVIGAGVSRQRRTAAGGVWRMRLGSRVRVSLARGVRSGRVIGVSTGHDLIDVQLDDGARLLAVSIVFVLDDGARLLAVAPAFILEDSYDAR